MRSATTLVLALVLLATPTRARADAKQLGDAYSAFDAGDFERALTIGRSLKRNKLHNPDYADYVVAQSAYMTGRYALARSRFRDLAKNKRSRFGPMASWRVADCDWALGHTEAARKAYERLLKTDPKEKKMRRKRVGDPVLAMYRIAEAHAQAERTTQAVRSFRALWMEHPEHLLADNARRRARQLGGPQAAALSNDDRILRADRLTRELEWRPAILELDQMDATLPPDVQRRRTFQLGRTLFKMRRQYRLAGELLLSVWKDMGKDADWALFHGARGISRAHNDAEAIGWYQKVVKEFPRSDFAAEAQYLSGWLEFNQGNYAAAKPGLTRLLARYPRSKWAELARWYLAYSHYMLGEYSDALPMFARLAKKTGKLEGGKGRYWHARTLQKLDRGPEAIPEYRALVGAYPFSWYAQLARSRLAEAGEKIGPFGDSPRSAADAPTIDTKLDPKLAKDPSIQRVDELIEAGLDVEAGLELRRDERAFIKRHGRPAGLAVVLDRYRRANNFNRPWMIAVVYGGNRALDAPPTGPARLWWEHAYPRAYRELVEKYRSEGDTPDYYLYSIMRKESGFNPHTISYANALGLLQMIPPTTRNVIKAFGMEYSDDLLYDPEFNIRAGSWYIGRLLHKFKNQIPVAAASYNGGPGAVMRWLEANGKYPLDEYVELISYTQARGYGKKVTETYARYLYLYEDQIYNQPLTLDPNYIRNDITY